MSQYNFVNILIGAIIIVVVALNIIAFIKKKKSESGEKMAIADIHQQFFPEKDFAIFKQKWSKFCEIVGTQNAHEYLEQPVPVMETFFPFSDLLYEDIEEFLPHKIEDIDNMNVRELLDIFYNSQSNS